MNKSERDTFRASEAFRTREVDELCDQIDSLEDAYAKGRADGMGEAAKIVSGLAKMGPVSSRRGGWRMPPTTSWLL